MAKTVKLSRVHLSTLLPHEYHHHANACPFHCKPLQRPWQAARCCWAIDGQPHGWHYQRNSTLSPKSEMKQVLRYSTEYVSRPSFPREANQSLLPKVYIQSANVPYTVQFTRRSTDYPSFFTCFQFVLCKKVNKLGGVNANVTSFNGQQQRQKRTGR